jgi:mono/diheme cytochrome c family protein
MRKILWTFVLTVIATVFAIAAVVNSGVYSVAADEPHAWPVGWLLETTRKRSIERRAADIVVPDDLSDSERIRRGAGNYDAMCVGCHLRPGLIHSELSRGLSPPPPALAERRLDDPAAAFWVVRHGIKASGMPAWGASMDDHYIWDMVAFMLAMPALDTEAYLALVAASDGHAHGGGEDHVHHEDGHAYPHPHAGEQEPAAPHHHDGDAESADHRHAPHDRRGIEQDQHPDPQDPDAGPVAGDALPPAEREHDQDHQHDHQHDHDH